MTPQMQAASTTLSSQVDSILRVADLLENGVRGTTAIAERLNITRPTAIKYRNEALKLLEAENKGLNTQALRNMEIGRLHYWIDKLQVKIEALGNPTDKDDRLYLDKLLGRLDNFQGRLHAITGLNTTVNVNYEEQKRITFVMGEQTPNSTQATTPLQEDRVIDATVIDSSQHTTTAQE